MLKIRKSGNCTYKNHRGDFETCPDCSHRMDSDKWDSRIVIFITGEVQGKHDSGAAISDCPKCGYKSWTHAVLSGVHYRFEIKRLTAAATKELKRRELAAFMAPLY